MRKFLKTTIIIIVMVVLICLVVKLGILDFSIWDVNEEKLSSYSGYYFNQLELDEKKIYIKINETIKENKTKVFLGIKETSDIMNKVSKVFKAYFYDNPEIYYISNQYTISSSNFKLISYSILELNYTMEVAERTAKDKELADAIENLLGKHVNDTMTDFEKEVAIHDALVSQVEYYKYDNINNIPSIKHTAYGALVEKQAVCDGYSKAFKLLLDKVGINSIIISGNTENISHAWNLVNINNEYYHVDVTSDKLDYDSKKYVMHTYFNINDKKISKTHLIDESFDYPKCNETKHEYYKQKGLTITDNDNLYEKLKEITLKQNKSQILELKVSDKYSSKRIINTLYDLNFNNWRVNGKTSITYSQIEDVYIFILN